VLKQARVSQATYVPDAEHAQLIELPLSINHARHDARRMGGVQSVAAAHELAKQSSQRRHLSRLHDRRINAPNFSRVHVRPAETRRDVRAEVRIRS
jgi:hypothetical protein